MCIVSFIGTEWGKTVPDRYPWVQPYVTPPPSPWIPGPNDIQIIPPLPVPGETVSREEFEALRLEMQELKKLLQAAKEFDANTGQPDCEVDEKVSLLKRLAELVGVDLGEVLAA